MFDLSLQFWLKLLVAIGVLVTAWLYLNWSKFHFVQKRRAARLRLKVMPRMKAIIPMIGANLANESPQVFELFKLKADLEELALTSDVLFDVERIALSDFLTKLSSKMAMLETSAQQSHGRDDLVLAGQRVIKELTELG